uniref:Sugar transporter SWEET1 n=1 Tax=Ascaris suum TaxID=6253 RepID=F1L291_ASCSU
MFLENITVLGVLSVTATISTITLFFCGIPICVNIYKRRSTKDISGAPFLMGVLGASYWLRYGLLKMDFAMITVNVTAVSLMASYLIFYFFFTKPKLMISLEISAVLFMISIMAFLVQIYGHSIIHPLGFACMTFNIINFGAPLAGLRVVLRQRSCETLPLPLCIANFAVSSQWCLYGVLIKDIYLIIPNGIGMSLAIIQLALFVIFPMKEGKQALAKRLCGIDCTSSKKDVEAAKGASEEPMKQPLDATIPLIKTEKLKEGVEVAGKNPSKKPWIAETISTKDLGENDPIKKDSKQATTDDAVSMDGSTTTEVTEFNQSSESALKNLDSPAKRKKADTEGKNKANVAHPENESNKDHCNSSDKREDKKEHGVVPVINTV